MAYWKYNNYCCFPILGLLSLLLLHPNTTTVTLAIRSRLATIQRPPSPSFREAPAFRNGDSCKSSDEMSSALIHIVMPLDTNYIRGTMAAILSILQHSTCPENASFHFLTIINSDPEIISIIKSTFPYLTFKMYSFDPNRVLGKISKSIRQTLDQPLNYARIYISDILPESVDRAIYLDSDIIVVEDVAKLWEVDMEDNVLAAPEYCRANFTNYFTNTFWSDGELASTLEGRLPCYFNTGVMVVDVAKWRSGGYTEKVEEWMKIQRHKRIYDLGSLPPILLVFAGKIKAVGHSWNQHGLGGDNVQGKCRGLHPGPISLLHWSGKGKPWLRLDARRPCTVDHLWAPYDLYRSSKVALEE